MTTSQDNTDNTPVDKTSSTSTSTNSPTDSANTSTRKPAPPKKPSPTKTTEKVDQSPLAEPPRDTTDSLSSSSVPSSDSLPHKASEPPTVLPMFTAETSRQGSSLPTTVIMATAGIAVLLLLFLIRRLVRR